MRVDPVQHLIERQSEIADLAMRLRLLRGGKNSAGHRFGARPPWGLFQYYCVMAKIALTTLATIVLLLQLRLIDYMASKTATGFLLSEDLRGAKFALVVHAAGGLLVLVLVTILSVYKPRGMTMYGQSKLRDQQAAGRQ